MKTLYSSIVATLILVILFCGAYPLAVTGLGQLLFHEQTNGSMIYGHDGKILGSKLIGQSFTKPEYFHGRPSAAGNGYDAANSSGSNLGPTNQKLADGLKANVDSFLKENPTIRKGEIPNDLVTSSASGLDPHISPEGALAQVERVARVRKLDPRKVRELVQQKIQDPQLGLLGEPTVNVLELNLALEELR
jgi:K+-transporting ATPase ATPase C chain